MSSTIAVRVENLSKRYRIGRSQLRHDTLRDALVAAFHRNGREAAAQELWALKDIFFEVKCGEIVGIIGRNGAGKSTLLKILSRITEPTTGEAEMHGRVGSLLEVGTGFHPELTGRENIYLNGAILGMRRFEIDRKFDEIVAFSEVEKFLDTPVKRYSSGMYVRLAFAVAAHLEPEILLVDEVLAVGDAQFQQKCLGKMGDVAHGGRTVLFVSHNMAAVRTLCRRSILLSDGMALMDGDTEDVINAYLSSLQQVSVKKIRDRTDRSGNGRVRLVDIEILDKVGKSCTGLQVGQPVRFVFHLDRPTSELRIVWALYDSHGHLVADFDSSVLGAEDQRSGGRCSRLICDIDHLGLVPAHYRMNVALFVGGVVADHVEAAVTIPVEEGIVHGRFIRRGTRGTTVVPHRWTHV